MAEYALRLTNGTDTAPRVRRADALGLAHDGPTRTRTGLRPDGGGVTTVVDGTMQVQVTAHSGWINGGATDAQGGYVFVCDALATLTVTDGHASLDRIDTVAAVVYDDAYDGSGQTSADLVVLAGTPGSGVPPALPATALPLRDVLVPAGASAGTGGLAESNLAADRRTYTAAAGGVVPVSGAVERDAMAAEAGQVVYRADTTRLEKYDGTKWGPVAPAEVAVDTLGAQHTVTTGAADVGVGVTVECPGPEAVYLVHLSADCERSAGTGILIMGIKPGNLPTDPGTAQLQSEDRVSLAKTWRVTGMASGTQTIKATAYTTAGTYVVRQDHTQLIVDRRA